MAGRLGICPRFVACAAYNYSRATCSGGLGPFQGHERVMQALAVSLDSAVDALTDPSAPAMEEEMRAARAKDSAAKARAMNVVLHEEIRQLHKKAEAAQEEEARRQTVNRAAPPARCMLPSGGISVPVPLKPRQIQAYCDFRFRQFICWSARAQEHIRDVDCTDAWAIHGAVTGLPTSTPPFGRKGCT